MLVLTRGIGESIHIGTEVEFKIISTGRRVKVGIEAPPEIEILRGEIRAKQQRQPTQTGEDKRPTSRFAVLLVEDDPVHAKIITHILRKRSLSNIAVASSGEEAVRNLWEREDESTIDRVPNLILLDLKLPRMSGLDVLVRIKSDRQLRKTPVVMLSSTKEPSEIERCLDAGANAFVTKSPDHKELRSSLSRIADFWASECRAPGPSGLN